MTNKYEQLEADQTYHIYNRANGRDLLFTEPARYYDFLRRLYLYVAPVMKIQCLSLLPNHFHLMGCCRSRLELENLYLQIYQGTNKEQTFLHASNILQNEILRRYTNQQFANMFNGFAQKVNLQDGRKGNLFMRPYKRKKIISAEYRNKLVHYILRNPVLAGHAANASDYRFSSYQSIISGVDDNAREVLSWFDGAENFRKVMDSPTFPIVTM
jgi:hypothetical protein